MLGWEKPAWWASDALRTVRVLWASRYSLLVLNLSWSYFMIYLMVYTFIIVAEFNTHPKIIKTYSTPHIFSKLNDFKSNFSLWFFITLDMNKQCFLKFLVLSCFVLISACFITQAFILWDKIHSIITVVWQLFAHWYPFIVFFQFWMCDFCICVFPRDFWIQPGLICVTSHDIHFLF